ncbi:hypothetical protein [Sphingomonas sp. MMS24-J13]|uniref:hypothetical protein n=1 Tax=Sphingomonas sp. MMS24-J13 TaxID=3238686 RepID=UPI0038507180
MPRPSLIFAASQRRTIIVLAIILIIAAIVQGVAYWPGLMTWDAINQYGQATEGVFDDWHPPIMAWIWRQFIAIKPGPASMYLLQLGLYWLGYALIVAGAVRRGWNKAAIVTVAVALMPFPLALMGSVLKDCLMQGALLTATGLFIWSGPERGWGVRITGIALLVFAGMLRFNAFLATLPLVVAFLPAAFRRTPLRMVGAAIVSLAVLVAAMPVANRLIGADKSDVELSLVIFDMAGITKHTGIDMFPPIGVPNIVGVNAACYHPDKWDYYSTWAPEPCPITFKRIDEVMDQTGAKPYPTLVRAIVAHPIAYAEHRLGHFNINSRFLVHDEVQGPVPERPTENEWHFDVTPNAALTAITKGAEGSIHSPLGWPIFWMALAGGLLAIGWSMPSAWLTIPMAMSTLFYGLGYLPFSVSSELRYNLWTITGTAIAAGFVIADYGAGATVPRSRLIAALAPAVIVGMLCTIWRLT